MLLPSSSSTDNNCCVFVRVDATTLNVWLSPFVLQLWSHAANNFIPRDTYVSYKKSRNRWKICNLEIASPSGNGSLLYSQSKEAEGFYVIDGEFSFQYRD